jgi:tetrahydromethanopterin S-methyltransferase subunit G
MENKELRDYFIKVTHERFEKIERRFDLVDAKLEKLIGWRWMLIGAGVAVSAIVSMAMQFLLK